LEGLIAFSNWLEHTPVSVAVNARGWFVPAIQVVHIMAIAAVVVAALLINLRAAGLVERERSLAVVTASWLPVLFCAIAVIAASGFLLIASEPGRALFRTVFWVKLVLVGAALLATWAQRAVGEARPRALHVALALAALACWSLVIFAGRWIAYADGWPGAPA